MARLTYRQRKRLPRSAFAIPEKDGYPVHDVAHARNALARVAQHGTPEEKARVRAVVRRRYPQIGRRRRRGGGRALARAGLRELRRRIGGAGG